MDCPKRGRDMEDVAASGLPDDPLVEILSRVPAKSLCRFKCVSKAWRELIADPLHRKKLPQTLEGFFFMFELHECHEEGDSDDEPCTCYGGDGESHGSRYGFIDILQRSVRPVDFSYLTELPGIKNTRLVHCCNGLLLFAVKCSRGFSWSYVVCNPATKQCVPVPSSGLEQNETFYGSAVTYLLFDPAVAPCHFNLVQFKREGYQKSVRVYSSKTQAWSHNKPDLGCYDIVPDHYPSVYANGMLHLISHSEEVTVLDGEGNIQKIIPPPFQAGREKWTMFNYVGWSQGRLHYINIDDDDDDDDDDVDDDEEEIDSDGCVQCNVAQGCLHYISSETLDNDEEIDGDVCGRTEPSFRGFLIWVLEDYERQQWVLKDTVSFSKLLGERNCRKEIDFDYDVVGIHPDHSLVFLAQLWDRKLISYHMDSKEVRYLCSLGHGNCRTPYVPCFSELLPLENKQ